MKNDTPANLLSRNGKKKNRKRKKVIPRSQCHTDHPSFTPAQCVCFALLQPIRLLCNPRCVKVSRIDRYHDFAETAQLSAGHLQSFPSCISWIIRIRKRFSYLTSLETYRGVIQAQRFKGTTVRSHKSRFSMDARSHNG